MFYASNSDKCLLSFRYASLSTSYNPLFLIDKKLTCMENPYYSSLYIVCVIRIISEKPYQPRCWWHWVHWGAFWVTNHWTLKPTAWQKHFTNRSLAFEYEYRRVLIETKWLQACAVHSGSVHVNPAPYVFVIFQLKWLKCGLQPHYFIMFLHTKFHLCSLYHLYKRLQSF